MFSSIFVLIGVLTYFIYQVKLEEDITSLIPMDDRISEMSQTFANSKFADQLIFTVSLKDTNTVDERKLIEVVDSLSHFLRQDTALVKEIRNTVDEAATAKVYDYFYRNLPIYMTDADYAYLDTIVSAEHLNALMKKNYRSIIAPTGFGTSKYILKDPLSLVPRFLKKLESFQLDKNFGLYKSHIFTKDRKHTLAFLDPKYSSKNTKQNRLLIENIDQYLASAIPEDVHVEYYGGTAVAVANANRVQKDIITTISIAVVLLLLLFVAVFKNIKVLAYLFLPVVLGVGISIVLLSFMYSTISAIALGVGAILIGISIDFSLHYFSHVRYGHSAQSIIKDISDPVIMSSLTTASAFLCLNVVNSQALNQLGLFAGMSVLASSVLVLILLPLLFRKKVKVQPKQYSTIIDKFAGYDFHKNKYWITGVIVLTIVFSILGRDITFDADIANLNYLPKELSKAETNLKSISSAAASAIYVVTDDASMNGALEKLEQHTALFRSLEKKGVIASLSSVNSLLVSESKQKAKIEKWNYFWEKKGLASTIESINEAGTNNHFKTGAFKSFFKVLNKQYTTISDNDISLIRKLFLSNLISEHDSKVSLVSICKVDQSQKEAFFSALNGADDLLVLDKQFFTNQFFELLRDDFNKLINYSMLVVFLIVLIFWGRFELALITFIPIALSWQWTIGLMGLFNVDFNIFNIIICTFIFGLGIDYSIFVMQGLMNNYKYGDRSILPYKVSIILSVSTTLIGVGVLIFAKHPALKSIALVTIFGIFSVIIITFTILPFLFNWLTHTKDKKRQFPIILLDIVVSFVSFVVFLAGVIFLSVLVLLFKYTPLFTDGKKKVIHYLLFLNCKLVVGINFLFKKEYIDKYKLNLDKPAVLVCNHQSHLDIALILLLSPKIFVLTNEWVWKNPFYGLIIRYIDFYPIYTGIDNGYEKIKAKVDKGYSVLIFPEGTRTKDGNILRFHQGAFSLADYLGLDILPILLHGAYNCMPKTEFFLRAGHVTLKFFDRIKVEPVDIEKGITYRPQAKKMTAFYRKQYALLRKEKETVDFFARKLINQYVFKGPVLEWYLRVKISLEKNYRFYDELLPKTGKIVDVGCGYGFLSNMLSYTAEKREIVGWDYDSEKISVAKEVATDLKQVSFAEKDIVTQDFESADVFVFNDVLHYFSQEHQLAVLNKAYHHLNNGGFIVIRDADTELKERTKFTLLTEFFSIKLLGFNKMEYELSFFSSKSIEQFAKDHQMHFTKVDNAKYTSNLTYILKKAE